MVEFISMLEWESLAYQNVRQLNEFNFKSTRWIDLDVENSWCVQWSSCDFQWVDWRWNRFYTTDVNDWFGCQEIFAPAWYYVWNLKRIFIWTLGRNAFQCIKRVSQEASHNEIWSGSGDITDSNGCPVGIWVGQQCCNKFFKTSFRSNFYRIIDSIGDLVFFDIDNWGSDLKFVISD